MGNGLVRGFYSYTWWHESFVKMYAKLLSPEVLILAKNVQQIVWWPGSAQTCWESLQHSHRPIATLRVWGPWVLVDGG